jgi:hypothetical protein
LERKKTKPSTILKVLFMENSPTLLSFTGRNTAMSADELRKARETRAADALRMKDEQIKILTEQNANLLKALDKVTINTSLVPIGNNYKILL